MKIDNDILDDLEEDKIEPSTFFHDFLMVHRNFFFAQDFKRNLNPSKSTILVTLLIYIFSLLFIKIGFAYKQFTIFYDAYDL